VIGSGRFLVKRSRGKQEGYLIMAPFIVNTSNFRPNFDEDTYFLRNHNRKFLINLGWLPKSRKASVFASIGTQTFGEEVYTDRL
jgi:cytochrome oxidase assembly protein ShyY1